MLLAMYLSKSANICVVFAHDSLSISRKYLSAACHMARGEIQACNLLQCTVPQASDHFHDDTQSVLDARAKSKHHIAPGCCRVAVGGAKKG